MLKYLDGEALEAAKTAIAYGLENLSDLVHYEYEAVSEIASSAFSETTKSLHNFSLDLASDFEFGPFAAIVVAAAIVSAGAYYGYKYFFPENPAKEG